VPERACRQTPLRNLIDGKPAKRAEAFDVLRGRSLKIGFF
jgi:hypothetical protein